MFVIRDQQMRVLERVPSREFETQVMHYLRRFYPRECRLAGDLELRKFVRNALDGAASYGLRTKQTAGVYVLLAIMLGSDFDKDPQIPWAALDLENQEGEDAQSLADGLFRKAVDYLGAIAGDDSELMLRCLIRLRKHDYRAPVRSSPEESLPDAVWALLSRLSPEKAERQGSDATMAMIRVAQQAAEKYGLAGDQGLTLYCILAFMLGSGFASDPMYWWAGPILSNGVLSPEAKFDGLLARSLQYLEDSLRD